MNLFLGTYYQLVHVKGISWYFLPKSLTLPPVKFLARFLPSSWKKKTPPRPWWLDATQQPSVRKGAKSPKWWRLWGIWKEKTSFFSTKLWPVDVGEQKTCTWNVFFLELSKASPNKRKTCLPYSAVYHLSKKSKTQWTSSVFRMSNFQIGHQEVRSKGQKEGQGWKDKMLQKSFRFD